MASAPNKISYHYETLIDLFSWREKFLHLFSVPPIVGQKLFYLCLEIVPSLGDYDVVCDVISICFERRKQTTLQVIRTVPSKGNGGKNSGGSFRNEYLHFQSHWYT